MQQTSRRPAALAVATILAGLAAALISSPVAHAAPAAGAAADDQPPWPSGFGNLELGREFEHLQADIAGYLRRPTPVFTSFFPLHGSLQEANAALAGRSRLWSQLTAAKIRIAQTVPLVMSADTGNIARILNPGDPLQSQYLAFWTALGKGLREARAVAPILRIGHEMNLTAGFPWSYGNPALTAPAFVALYKLAADAIRAEVPDAVRAWNPGRRTRKGRPEDLWPGDGYVDAVCLDWYDNGTGGFVTSEAAWTALANATDSHGPVGIIPWYEFARARKKPFCVPEWGLDGPYNRGRVPTDRPLYIQKMHDFFARIRSDLLFESYYNYDLRGTGRHQLYPVVPARPRSSRLYQRLFGRP